MGSINKPALTVKVEIHPSPASPAQQEAWRWFWVKLIADTNHDLIKSQTNNARKEVKDGKDK